MIKVQSASNHQSPITNQSTYDTSQSTPVTKHNILDPVYIYDIQNDPHKSNTITFQDPSQDIKFSHDFIVSEIEKFGLVEDGCHKCSQLVKHFQDPRSLHDKIAENQIIWIKYPESIMKNPFPNLTTPIFDPSNINVQQPHN